MQIFRSIFILALLTCFACKNKEETTVTKNSEPGAARSALTTSAVTSSSSSIENQDGLFAMIPETADAFFFWDLSGQAFDRFLDSPWGKNYISKSSSISSRMPELAGMLKEAGIDFSDPKSLKQKTKEALIFASGGAASTNGCFIFRTNDQATAKGIVASLKSSAERQRVLMPDPDDNVAFELNFAGRSDPVSGLQENRKVRVIAAAKDEDVILSNDPATIKQILSGQTAQFNSASLKKLSVDAPGKDERIGLGFIDIKEFAGKEEPETPSPITSAFLSVKMTDRPFVNFKLEKGQGTEWAALNPPTKDILAALPPEPILFTVFQAGVLRDMLTKGPAGGFMNDSQFAPLKNIQQIAIGAKASAEAQAMLPIPELIIAAETLQPAELSSALIASATSAVKGYGIPVEPTEMEIAGKKIKTIPGAMGISLYIAETDHAVIVATSQALLQDALQRLGSGDPLRGSLLSASALEKFSSKGLGRLYLSFPELTKLLESARGMASLSAGPHSSSVEDALSPESLKELSDLGAFMGSLNDDGNIVSGEISYL